MPGNHALLSASSAHRWLMCTAAPKMEENLPDKTSPYAQEGSLAHTLAELKANLTFSGLSQRIYRKERDRLKRHPLWQAEMDIHTDAYVSGLTEAAARFSTFPHLAFEVRVDYSHLAPGGFGTADAVLLGSGTLCVCDFKYGKGLRVRAGENPQLMLYALGALRRYLPVYGESITAIEMMIIQPRLSHIEVATMTREALLAWGAETVKPAAAVAATGKGTFHPGDWCRFCKAKAICRAKADECLALEDFAFALPPQLTISEISDVLQRGKRLKDWVEAVERFALERALQGEVPPGMKVVAGKSVRQFSDAPAALQALRTAGIAENLLYDRQPKSLAQLEKAIGAAEFKQMVGAYLVKPSGKPTLAAVDDPRPDYRSAEMDFQQR